MNGNIKVSIKYQRKNFMTQKAAMRISRTVTIYTGFKFMKKVYATFLKTQSNCVLSIFT